MYLAAGGRGNKAAVIHDYLYTVQIVDRETADKVLEEAMAVIDATHLDAMRAKNAGKGKLAFIPGTLQQRALAAVSKVTRGSFYAAVRLGGESHWNAPNLPQETQVTAAMPEAP